jgi:hypothetical protein
MADYTAPALSLVHITCPEGCGGTDADFFGPEGWPTEPSRIYFGGDDGTIFRDFSVIVAAPGLPGDYNGNGNVDAADYVVWRAGGPLLNEGASNGTVDQADYNFWRAQFGSTSGGGASLVAAAIPEPNSFALLVLALVASTALFGRRGTK